MFEMELNPRFNDTDALGHINNASINTWFEEARRPFFKFFVPDLDPKKWNLIIARVEIDYLAQAEFSEKTTVKSWFEKIGKSSMTMIQEATQKNTVVARGRCVMVHFDYSQNKSQTIPDSIREKLEKHLA